MNKYVDGLRAWEPKVREAKGKRKKNADLDIKMFNDILVLAISKLEASGYAPTMAWLKENVEGKQQVQMVGVILLKENSQLIYNKLWSINSKIEKVFTERERPAPNDEVKR